MREELNKHTEWMSSKLDNGKYVAPTGVSASMTLDPNLGTKTTVHHSRWGDMLSIAQGQVTFHFHGQIDQYEQIHQQLGEELAKVKEQIAKEEAEAEAAKAKVETQVETKEEEGKPDGNQVC